MGITKFLPLVMHSAVPPTFLLVVQHLTLRCPHCSRRDNDQGVSLPSLRHNEHQHQIIMDGATPKTFQWKRRVCNPPYTDQVTTACAYNYPLPPPSFQTFIGISNHDDPRGHIVGGESRYDVSFLHPPKKNKPESVSVKAKGDMDRGVSCTVVVLVVNRASRHIPGPWHGLLRSVSGP